MLILPLGWLVFQRHVSICIFAISRIVNVTSVQLVQCLYVSCVLSLSYCHSS